MSGYDCYIANPYNVSEYFFEVVRDRQAAFGEGIITAYQNGHALEQWPCITGGDKLDPAAYGGITPPMDWIPVEDMRRRSPEGRRSKLLMARIRPWSYGAYQEFFPDRSVDLPPQNSAPFMAHGGSRRIGSSTGCVVILERLDEFSDVWNQAFLMGLFVLRVRDK